MDEAEFRDLQERSSFISEMADHPGWSLLVDRARHSVFTEQRRMVLGKLTSFEEYKSRVAWMDGVSFVLDLPERVRQELDRALQEREENKEE